MDLWLRLDLNGSSENFSGSFTGDLSATVLTIVVVNLALVQTAGQTHKAPQACQAQQQRKQPGDGAVGALYSRHTYHQAVVALNVERCHVTSRDTVGDNKARWRGALTILRNRIRVGLSRLSRRCQRLRSRLVEAGGLFFFKE